MSETNTPEPGEGWNKGPLAWFARNSVAANIIMLVFIIGGLVMASNVRQEVFPEVSLDVVRVQVPYPGAGPEEVEQGVILAVEEAVRGVDGIKEIRGTAQEGTGLVTAELLTTTDPNEALNDIKSAVDRITSLPQDAERPVISLLSNRRQVISLVIYGERDEKTLKGLAEEVRDELLQLDEVTVVELGGVRPPEISIEVPQDNLRKYGLSLPAIAERVRQASIELPGGGLKTEGGEVLVRTTERRERGVEFRDVAVLARPDGTRVTLEEIADIRDGFKDIDLHAYFDGRPAVRVDVYRVGDQTPLEIAGAVNEYTEQKQASLADGVSMATWNDRSEIYRDRINLLLKNAYIGLFLVLLVLGLFLDPKLAFWVTVGITISVLGAFLFMPALDVSINMISLFAFILTLGIVVDDAIVVGEAVYHQRSEGRGMLEAAVYGVREVAVPVTFSVLTTVVAFTPLLFVPGISGKFFVNIPLIVIPILLISLVEGLIVLPSHLAHGKKPRDKGLLGAVSKAQAKFSDGLERFVDGVYRPFAEYVFAHRYITLAASLALLIISIGFVAGGHIKFSFLPKVEGDQITGAIEMPFGTPVEDTERVKSTLVAAAYDVMEESVGRDVLSRGIYAAVGQAAPQGGPGGGTPPTGSHIGFVQVYLTGAEGRAITTADFSRRWRDRVGEIAGVENLSFNFNIGPQAGSPVQIELSHRDDKILERAASRLAEHIDTYTGTFDVNDGFTLGKDQLDLKLRPEARALGLTESDLARQIRANFFGAEVARQQRGREELRIYVRRPERERTSEEDIENLLVITPNGGEIPLREAAYIDRNKSFTKIDRVEGRRVLSVTADVDETVATGEEITRSVVSDYIPELQADIPGLTYSIAGEQQERAESLGALARNFLVALLVMFAMMAMAFRSYTQPIVLMAAIPFGFVGALAGHLIMGFGLSIISMFGVVALSGVVVNDSLVLVAAINDFRRDEGMSAYDAVVAAGVRRFRPILLTSLTTFFGLAPMIFETSPQARFLIPMALSLGFGILFVTIIALVIVPSLYLALEDVKSLVSSAVDTATDVIDVV